MKKETPKEIVEATEEVVETLDEKDTGTFADHLEEIKRD